MAEPNWATKTIWTGDCLDIMRGMNAETVDLIYLDRRSTRNANYAAPIGSQGRRRRVQGHVVTGPTWTPSGST